MIPADRRQHPPPGVALTPARSRGPASRAAVLVCLGGLLWLTSGCYRPSAPVQTLRDALQEATDTAWMSEIELGVGGLTFTLARAGSAFVDLPPEARAVLRSVRGADVGVYRLRNPDRVVSGATLLPAADRALGDRGWDRLVGVLDGPDKTVAVYVSREPESSRRLKLCVVVLEGPQMVIVAARGNPEPLLELALEQARREAGLPADR